MYMYIYVCIYICMYVYKHTYEPQHNSGTFAGRSQRTHRCSALPTPSPSRPAPKSGARPSSSPSRRSGGWGSMGSRPRS